MSVLETLKKGIVSKPVIWVSAIVAVGASYFTFGKSYLENRRHRQFEDSAREIFQRRYPELADKYQDPQLKRVK